jgi:hypothetical protein
MNECAYDAEGEQKTSLRDAAFEKRFIEYLRNRAAVAKVARDDAARMWAYSTAQEYMLIADVCEDLADFLASGDAIRELK